MPRASFLSVLTGREDRKRCHSDNGQASIPASSIDHAVPLRQPLDKRAWLARNLTQPLHRAVVVDNADSSLREGYVEPDENEGGLLVSWLNSDRP